MRPRYPGEEGGTALANILFGATNPSGRMPITVVESIAQLPDYLDLHMGLAPGRTHRHFTGTPMYTFGYGLSYPDGAISCNDDFAKQRNRGGHRHGGHQCP